MQIHWFSPLPPVDVPAATCTALAIPVLAQRCSLTLWTAQDAWDQALEKIALVRRYSLSGFPWREVNRGDVAVFHLGREPQHHGTIWRLLRQHAGIAVLYDACVHELYLRAPRPPGCADPDFVDECERIHGPAGRLAAEIFRGGLCSPEVMARAFPLLEPILEAASGVLVHDAGLARSLARRAGPPVVYARPPLETGAQPDAYVEALLRLAAVADSRYAASLVMADRVGSSMNAIATPQSRAAVADRAALAIISLLERRTRC